MSDLYIADCDGAVLAGYYSKDKMISYVTGYAVRDQGDTYVRPFLVGFNKDLPLGTKIHVQTTKDLGLGLDFNQELTTIPDHPMYDLTGKKLGVVPCLELGTSWYMKDSYKYNGTYEFTISYNDQTKHFTMVINAKKED